MKKACLKCWMILARIMVVNESPPPRFPILSHSNHQLEMLFIDPLLPSASSSPLFTPVSFLSHSLALFVSRAVGQCERDVTGTQIVRGRKMRGWAWSTKMSSEDSNDCIKKTDMRAWHTERKRACRIELKQRSWTGTTSKTSASTVQHTCIATMYF